MKDDEVQGQQMALHRQVERIRLTRDLKIAQEWIQKLQQQQNATTSFVQQQFHTRVRCLDLPLSPTLPLHDGLLPPRVLTERPWK